MFYCLFSVHNVEEGLGNIMAVIQSNSGFRIPRTKHKLLNQPSCCVPVIFHFKKALTADLKFVLRKATLKLKKKKK